MRLVFYYMSNFELYFYKIDYLTLLNVSTIFFCDSQSFYRSYFLIDDWDPSPSFLSLLWHSNPLPEGETPTLIMETSSYIDDVLVRRRSTISFDGLPRPDLTRNLCLSHGTSVSTVTVLSSGDYPFVGWLRRDSRTDSHIHLDGHLQ